MSADRRPAAIDNQRRALADAAIDESGDPVTRSAGDDGSHLDAGGVAGSGRHASRARRKTLHQRVGDVAHRNDGRDGHAALAGRAVTGADDRFRREVEIGIGHDDRMVLGAAQRLHALAVARARLVDVFRDRRRADERYGAYLRMREQRVDGFLVAVNDVEHAIRKARLLQKLAEAQRQRRIALRRLQHERIAAADCDRKHPHRHHRREVERRDARANANGHARRPAVDVGADAVAVLAFEQMRNACRELDHLHAARNRALGVGERLAVLLRHDLRQILLVPVEQVTKSHQHTRTPQRRCCRPCAECLRCRCNGGVDVGTVGEWHVPDDLAGGRVGHFAVARRRGRVSAASDPHRQAFERCQVHRHSSIAGRFDCLARCTKLVATGCRFAAHCGFMRPLVWVALHVRLYSHHPPGSARFSGLMCIVSVRRDSRGARRVARTR